MQCSWSRKHRQDLKFLLEHLCWIFSWRQSLLWTSLLSLGSPCISDLTRTELLSVGSVIYCMVHVGHLFLVRFTGKVETWSTQCLNSGRLGVPYARDIEQGGGAGVCNRSTHLRTEQVWPWGKVEESFRHVCPLRMLCPMVFWLSLQSFPGCLACPVAS
jgi:hypothetical protein